jgi:hypothetical protein
VNDEINKDYEVEVPKEGKVANYARRALQAIGGAVPSLLQVHGQRANRTK